MLKMVVSFIPKLDTIIFYMYNSDEPVSNTMIYKGKETMKTKIELINGKYYDVTYDENDVAILMVLIGNHDDMLSQINFMLKEKSDEIISLKEELQSKEFCEKVSQIINKKNEEKIRKVKSLLNNLRGDYISIDAIGKFLLHALEDKYSLEEFECEIKSKNLAHDQSKNHEDIHDLKNWKKLEVEQFNVLMDIFHTPCLMFKLKK